MFRSPCQLCSAREKPGNIFAAYVTHMKFAGAGDAVGLVDEFCLGNRDELVEHSVHADVASPRLVNQPRNWRRAEIGLDSIRVQRSGKTARPQTGHDDVPVRIVHFLPVAIQERVADQLLIQCDSVRDRRLICVARSNGF